MIATISALDDDVNQTLTYLTSNPLFTIRNNELILNKALDHNLRETIPVYIRATDDEQPPTFVKKDSFQENVEKFFLIFRPRNCF